MIEQTATGTTETNDSSVLTPEEETAIVAEWNQWQETRSPSYIARPSLADEPVTTSLQGLHHALLASCGY